MKKRILYKYIIPAIMVTSVILIILQITKNTTIKNHLVEAVKHGTFSDIENAIKNGGDINGKNAVGQTPLHSVSYKGDPERIRFLIELGADLNSRDDRGGTPLHWAVINGKIKNSSMLLKLGANPNATDNKGSTPLHWAITALKINEKTKKANMLLLLDNKADPSIKDIAGKTALDYARGKKLNSIINFLKIYMDIE